MSARVTRSTMLIRETSTRRAGVPVLQSFNEPEQLDEVGIIMHRCRTVALVAIIGWSVTLTLSAAELDDQLNWPRFRGATGTGQAR
jgi:hypothetical protein